MYNRYIPQPDGSHRRRFMPDQYPRPAPPCREPPLPQSCATPPPEPECPQRPTMPEFRPGPCAAQQGGSALSFLKNLFPADFDTGDLLIVLLLLLMAGDCQEDQNWAWLTLALYLFL